MTSATNSSPAQLNRRMGLREDRVTCYTRMVEIRLLEDRVLELFAEGLIQGSTHTCQGQEAIAIGLAIAADIRDVVTCTYRGHGIALALGVHPTRVLGEIMGREIGTLRGLGGSMHLCDPSVGLLPTFAIVGAGLPVAAGAALSARVLTTGSVAFAVFGDGAANIGAFHETLNLAAIWRLPVVFVCENNLYGEYSPIERTTPIQDIACRAQGYGMYSEIVDGQDVSAVSATLSAAADRARSGDGPSLIECKTYRYVGHSRGDPGHYRPAGELDVWRARDPIAILLRQLEGEGLATQADAARIQEDAGRSVSEWVDQVMASPPPPAKAMFEHVYADGEKV